MPPKYYLEDKEKSLIEQQINYYLKMIIISNGIIQDLKNQILYFVELPKKNNLNKVYNIWCSVHIVYLKKQIAKQRRAIGFFKYLIYQREGSSRQNYYK